MKRILPCLFLLLILASCDEKVDWPLQPADNNFIVVDGVITDEMKPQQIRITRPVSDLNETPPAVSGAEVIVSGDNSVFHFSEVPFSGGTYQSDTLFAGKIDKEYSLLITSAGRVYSAKARMVAGDAAFPAIEYVRDSGKDLYSIKRVSNPFNPVHPAIFELLLDWSSVPGYEAEDSASTHARMLYYSLPTLDVSEVLAPSTETVFFPAGTRVVERSYSLTTEHAAFLRAMLSETTWQGGLFNSATANVPTNLSSGALGFFGACDVNVRSDRVSSLK